MNMRVEPNRAPALTPTMNWIYRGPLVRQQANNTAFMHKGPHRPPAAHESRSSLANLPIDAVRLQLADYRPTHPSAHPRPAPYVRTFPNRPSLRRILSSMNSVSTFETDLVHQRVSTPCSSPSTGSIAAREEVINETDGIFIVPDVDDDNLDGPKRVNYSHEQRTNEIEEDKVRQCRSCSMLMDVVDQQAQQIRQYNEQISQQADLLAKLARRLAGIEEEIDERLSEISSARAANKITQRN